MTFPVIDAHQHVWDPARAHYDWLDESMAPIDRAMTFVDVLPELRAAGVSFTVQVQSADVPEDTELMRESAARHPEVAGIVGYAPLDDPSTLTRTLDSWAGDPLMVGVRTLIHNNPDPAHLLRDDVADGLRELERRGLTFDIVAVLPRHLELVPILSERFPELRMVIDHLGKPPIGLEPGAAPWSGRWGMLMHAAAQNPLVHAKISGLYSATDRMEDWTTDAIRPFFDQAVGFFGADRLMYGGDWPISVLAGGYTRVWAGLQPLFSALSPDEREQVLGRTAASFYQLDVSRLGQE